MAFANFSVLAFGSLLMGVPLLLHLMMRRKPRHQVFPAMRFLQQRQVANQRRMRLRHWLLLALRIVVIGLLAALFARPSVDSVTSGSWLKAILLAALAPLAIMAAIYCLSERKGTVLLATFVTLSMLLLGGLGYFLFQGLTTGQLKNFGDQDAPVAAVLVFDTSPRMGLMHESKTRLQEAQVLARKLLQQLPDDSEVAIVDASGPSMFSVDIGNAINMLDSLQVLGYEYPLVDLVLRGYDLVSKRNDKRQELYVLTDLSEVVWKGSILDPVRAQLDQNPSVALFILDVGVQQPRNVQLGDLQLPSESIALGQPLRIETSLRSFGTTDQEQEVTVEVSIEQQDPTRPVIVDNEVLLPESIMRDRQQFRLEGDTEIPLVFDPGSLPSGIHHGRVQVSAPDGLPIDDARYFTVEVRPPTPVLLVAAEGAEPRYVEQAISPTEFREQNQNAFECRVIQPQDLPSVSLDDYTIVSLLDPGPLPERNWPQLETYVRSGGSLAMFLGRNASGRDGVPQFNTLAKSLLPGPLGIQWRTASDDYLFLSPTDTSHPILSLIRGRTTTISWDESPIFRHWSFSELNPGSNVILRYSNSQPAIVESVVGEGIVVTMTTPVSDRRRDESRDDPWNYLPTTEVPLPFFVLVNGMFPYLADQSDSTWNHPVTAVVELSPEAIETDATWQLFTPAMDWQNVRSDEGKLRIASTPLPGHYRLRLDRETTTGFSVNLPEMATNVKRLDDREFAQILGENRVPPSTRNRGTFAGNWSGENWTRVISVLDVMRCRSFGDGIPCVQSLLWPSETASGIT